ncbi:MAG: hypothetical protein SV253_08535 [Halobacteria archaeon]|nr:hypothetical protein [Halobacteria archaeon]
MDLQALKTIRNVFESQEPLVDSTEFEGTTGSLPRSLVVRMSDGVVSEGRFEVEWDVHGSYYIQYVETEDVRFRFDNHPNPHSPQKHYHPPPDSTSGSSNSAEPEPSCIQVEKPTLVARAVVKIWREWLENEDYSVINNLSNPP